MTAADDAIEALDKISTQQIRSELDNLRAIKTWAIGRLNLDYKLGDQVVIVSDEPSDTRPGHGWHPHRDRLRPGRVGTVKDIVFNQFHDIWQADVLLDGAVFFLRVEWVQKAGEQR